MLNAARFLAALLVFFSHAEYLLHERRLSALASFGHDAVIFFFILSGFVVSFAAKNKEKSFVDFAVARSSRLYSVAVPALVLTCALVWIGAALGIKEYSAHAAVNWFYVAISSGLFLNESWLGYDAVPTNAPYWSLNYEAWYYVLFGVAFYFRGTKRYVLLLAAAVIAGYKVLLLMPIWLAGVAFYKVHSRLQTRRLLGYACIVVPLVVYLWMRVNNLDDALVSKVAALFGGMDAHRAIFQRSERFVADYVIAALFLLIVYGLYMVRDDFKTVATKFGKPIATLADGTFTLYLLHYPLLELFGYVVPSSLVSLLLTLVLVTLISLVTERQKHQLAAAMRRLIGAPVRHRKAA